MNWLLFWIIIYLLVIIYLTIKHVKTKDPENYLVNNRSTKLLPLVITILATFVGGGTSIGLIAMGYESGFAAIGIGIAYVIGFMLMMRHAGKYAICDSTAFTVSHTQHRLQPKDSLLSAALTVVNGVISSFSFPAFCQFCRDGHLAALWL